MGVIHMKKTHIVILGAGYAGLVTARNLQKKINAQEVEITLVNKNEYHYETTWLHEASAGTLTPEQVSYPIKPLLDEKKVTFIQDTVTRIHHQKKEVHLQNSVLTYDYLVVALGFESETFGIQGLKEHAFSITNLHAAKQINEQLHQTFATYEKQQKESKEPLNIVVGGAGFTGIEFLGELVNQLPGLCTQYHIAPEQVAIHCLDAGPTPLAGFDEALVTYATDYLTKKGVTFHLSAAIKEVTKEGVRFARNDVAEEINSPLVIWAAGVRGNSILDGSDLPEVARGKIKVDPYLRAPGEENVFVIGDCSLIINEKINRPYPPTAQISMQQGENLAANLLRLLKGNKELTAFEYKPKGTVCSLGHSNAVGVVFGLKLKGFSASFMKKVIDNRALFLIGGVGLLFKKGKFK